MPSTASAPAERRGTVGDQVRGHLRGVHPDLQHRKPAHRRRGVGVRVDQPLGEVLAALLDDGEVGESHADLGTAGRRVQVTGHRHDARSHRRRGHGVQACPAVPPRRRRPRPRLRWSRPAASWPARAPAPWRPRARQRQSRDRPPKVQGGNETASQRTAHLRLAARARSVRARRARLPRQPAAAARTSNSSGYPDRRSVTPSASTASRRATRIGAMSCTGRPWRVRSRQHTAAVPSRACHGQSARAPARLRPTAMSAPRSSSATRPGRSPGSSDPSPSRTATNSRRRRHDAGVHRGAVPRLGLGDDVAHRIVAPRRRCRRCCCCRPPAHVAVGHGGEHAGQASPPR